MQQLSNNYLICSLSLNNCRMQIQAHSCILPVTSLLCSKCLSIYLSIYQPMCVVFCAAMQWRKQFPFHGRSKCAADARDVLMIYHTNDEPRANNRLSGFITHITTLPRILCMRPLTTRSTTSPRAFFDWRPRYMFGVVPAPLTFMMACAFLLDYLTWNILARLLIKIDVILGWCVSCNFLTESYHAVAIRL